MEKTKKDKRSEKDAGQKETVETQSTHSEKRPEKDAGRNKDVETQSTQSESSDQGDDSLNQTELSPGPLSIKLKQVISSINRMTEFVNSTRFTALDYYGAHLRQKRLESHWKSLEALYYQLICKLDESEIEALQESYEQADEVCFNAVALLRKKVAESDPKLIGKTTSENDTNQKQMNIKVTLEGQHHNIPNTWGDFDGNVLKWKGFHDRYVEGMHKLETVAPSYKFLRLKQSLVGKAAKALGEWQLTEDNYAEAWDRLKQLYDKPQLIAHEHLRQFYRLPELHGKASSNELQRMANVTHETIRQLRGFKLPVEHYDFIFVHNLQDRLDADTKKQWELQKSDDWPKLDDLLKFLDKQASVLANTQTKNRQNLNIAVPNPVPYPRFDRRQGDGARALSPSGGAIKKRTLCEVCDGNHPIHFCPEYLSLNLNGRLEFVRLRKLCQNCLRKDHRTNHCTDKTCGYDQCKENPYHNSTLCPFKLEKAARKAAYNVGQYDLHKKRPQE